VVNGRITGGQEDQGGYPDEGFFPMPEPGDWLNYSRSDGHFEFPGLIKSNLRKYFTFKFHLKK
jgi:hypothetical protein